ncbi:hypothetical protein EK904_007468 [Melospiza melodia maxima]|nr:hypothetical protein EK904_007468 [Melospiza melodia maxima]
MQSCVVFLVSSVMIDSIDWISRSGEKEGGKKDMEASMKTLKLWIGKIIIISDEKRKGSADVSENENKDMSEKLGRIRVCEEGRSKAKGFTVMQSNHPTSMLTRLTWYSEVLVDWCLASAVLRFIIYDGPVPGVSQRSTNMQSFCGKCIPTHVSASGRGQGGRYGRLRARPKQPRRGDELTPSREKPRSRLSPALQVLRDAFHQNSPLTSLKSHFLQTWKFLTTGMVHGTM